MSSLHAEKYVLVSEALAKEAVKNLAALTGNCNTTTRAKTPARWTSRTLRAARLPPPGHRRGSHDLMAAYAAGRTGGTYAEGIEVMIRAALQSSHFLYRLETTAPANATPRSCRSASTSWRRGCRS